MSQGYLVSIIIPCYKSENTILKVLDALSTQKVKIKYEIIVVNSSDDSTQVLIRERYSWVKLVQLHHKTPAGIARNKGARIAKGKYLAFVDSDCIVESNWLKSMLKHFSDDCCAIGGPIENANPKHLASFAGHILEFSQCYTKKGLLIVDHLPSGNIMLLKKTFDTSGGYPKNLFPQEDRFFCWKLKKETEKNLLFSSDIKVKHLHRTKFKEFLIHQFIIGRAGAELRKCTDIRGSWIIKKRWLVNSLLPVIPIIILIPSIYRTLKWKPKEFLLRPHVILLLCLGVFSRMIGFAKGANT